MLVFTGRLLLFFSLLALRIVESLLSLTIRLIISSFNSAWKNLTLFILNFKSEPLQTKTDP